MLLALAFRAVVRRTGLGQIREVGVVSGCPNKRKREGRVSYVVGVPPAFVRITIRSTCSQPVVLLWSARKTAMTFRTDACIIFAIREPNP